MPSLAPSMDLLTLWFIFAVVVGIVASSRQRSGLGWFLLAVFISPLLAGIVLLVLPKGSAEEPASPATHVKCPDCRELILREARVCKHCGCRLVPQA